MRVAVLAMCMGCLLADDLEVHDGVDTVPTSNWAEVYLSDSTDYREPVREESPFPVVEAASRSDWFHSYPYQKFEERKEEEPGIFEALGNSMKDSVDTIGNTVKDSVDTLGNTVKDSVGTVRNNFVGVGEGVVNGALRLVGAETLREKQAKAKAREGYVYHGTHLRGPGYRPNGHSRDTTVLQAEESQASGPVRHSSPDTPIHERLRQSIRGVLDPIIYNPIKKLLKTDGKKSAQVQRRQHAKLPNPITGLKDFGSHVAGGFSKLTGLGRGATAKVSQTLFPWLSGHSTEERAATAPSQHSALPLLPPVYVPVSPEQRAEDSQVLVQRVPAPPLPIFVPEPVQHTALPLPPYPVHDTHPPTNPPPSESASASLLFGIAPLINRLLAKNLPRPDRTPDLRPKVSNVVSRSSTKARPITARQDVIPSTLRNVMYYIPSPDLSGGVERNVPQLLEERSDAEDLEVVYSRPSLDQDEGFRPSIEVSRPRIDNLVQPDLAFGTSIEIDLSSGGSNEGEIDAWERAKILEKTLRQQIEEEAKVVRKIERGRTIELAPTDTLVFDLSQDWGTRIADEDTSSPANSP